LVYAARRRREGQVVTLADFAQVVHAGQCGCRTGPGKGHTKAAAAVLRAVAARCDELATSSVEQKSWTLEYRAGFHAAVDELAAELRRIAAEGTQT